MIGYSLSLCIKDVVEGKVNPNDITMLIVGTKCESEFDWSTVIKAYANRYWSADPHLGIGTTWRLVHAGKIIQPRVWGLTAQNLSTYNRWADADMVMLHYNDFIKAALIYVRKEDFDDEGLWEWEVC